MFDAQYVIKGKHATYVKFLSDYQKGLDKEKSSKNAGIFPFAVDVYMVAPLIGAAYNQMAPEDSDTQDSTTIFADAFIKRQKQLDTIYRLVMLAERESDLSDDERVTRAFREDEIRDKLSANLDLFHAYFRGGVEWLYEQATEDATTQQDYLRRIVELVNQFSEDFGMTELDSSIMG